MMDLNRALALIACAELPTLASTRAPRASDPTSGDGRPDRRH